MATAPSNTEEDNLDLLDHVHKQFDYWDSIGREITGSNEEVFDEAILELDPGPRKSIYQGSYPWTCNEYCVIAGLCDSKTQLAEFPLYLPHRTYEACSRKSQFHKAEGIGEGTNQGVKMARWTDLEAQQLVEHKKANMSWEEISKALNGPHSPAECRTQWFCHFWEEFNNSFVDGKFDIERYKEIMRPGGGIEAHDEEMYDAVDAEQHTKDGGLGLTLSALPFLAPRPSPRMPT